MIKPFKPVGVSDAVLVGSIETNQNTQMLSVNPANYKTKLSNNFIESFGSTSNTALVTFSEEILKHVSTGSLEDLGSKLNDVVLLSKKLNVKDIKGGFFNKLFGRVGVAKEKFIAQYESIDKQISKVLQDIETQTRKLQSNNSMLEVLFNKSQDAYKNLTNDIEKGEVLINEEKINYNLAESSITNDTDMIERQKIADWKAQILEFEQHLADLRAVQMMVVQSLPSIRSTQNGNSLIIKSFHKAKTMAIPAWKSNFAHIIALYDQKNAIESANSIADMTNEILIRQSELVKNNSIAAAKAGSRQIIDTETLEKVNNNLIDMFQEINQVEEEASKARAESKDKFEILKNDLRINIQKVK